MAERLHILQTALDWIHKGQKVYLFHVAQTWGSSPRPVGSLMAVNQDGLHVGSVSGGCVEADLFARIQALEFEHQPITLIDYNNTSHPHISLPCRGRMQLLLELIDDADTIRPMLEAIQQRTPIQRTVSIHTSNVVYSKVVSAQARFNEQSLSECYGPVWRVLLIGANDLAVHVAQQCLALDYEVIVADPREEYRGNWQLAATRLTTLMPDEAVDEYVRDEYVAVMALTHDPKLDDMAVMQALYSPAFYVGALGSSRSAERRKQNLAKMDIDPRLVEKLDAPIGLNIGSRSPAEIAVAIAARLIQVRNTRAPAQLGKPKSTAITEKT